MGVPMKRSCSCWKAKLLPSSCRLAVGQSDAFAQLVVKALAKELEDKQYCYRPKSGSDENSKERGLYLLRKL